MIKLFMISVCLFIAAGCSDQRTIAKNAPRRDRAPIEARIPLLKNAKSLVWIGEIVGAANSIGPSGVKLKGIAFFDDAELSDLSRQFKEEQVTLTIPPILEVQKDATYEWKRLIGSNLRCTPIAPVGSIYCASGANFVYFEMEW
jgi:hypothetical protein